MKTNARIPHRSHQLLAALLGLFAASASLADGSSRMMPRQVPAAYAQECAACHLAYPPALLPAASWQRMMGGLDKHFGSDASLDAPSQQLISSWLTANAGTYRRVTEAPPQDRITRSPWFERKHRKVDSSVWKLPSVKSAANCAACHTGAERGNFDDDNLKQPAGMDPRLSHAWHD